MRKILLFLLAVFCGAAYAQMGGVTVLPNGCALYPGPTFTCGAATIGPLAIGGTASYLYVDGSRSDTYTADGSYQHPYKTISAALAAMTGSGPYALSIAPGSYTDTGNFSGPLAFLTIYGNGSTWTVTGNITLNGAFYITDLKTVASGTLTYASTSPTESVRIGGSLTIAGGIFTSGYEHFFDMSILSNTLVTLNPGATPVFTNVVGTPRWKSASGATAATVLTIINSATIASGAYTAVDMSNGGLFTARGFAAINNGTVVNINLVGSSATGIAAPNILNGVQAAWTTAGTSFTTVDPTDYLPLLTGTSLNFLGPMQVAHYSLTGQTATLGATTLYTTTSSGVYRVTTSVTTTTSGTAGTVTVSEGPLTSSSISLASLAYTSISTTRYQASAGTAITFSTTVTSNSGGVYRVDAIVERVM